MLYVRRAVGESRRFTGGETETGETVEQVIPGHFAVSLTNLEDTGAGSALDVGPNGAIKNSRSLGAG